MSQTLRPRDHERFVKRVRIAIRGPRQECSATHFVFPEGEFRRVGRRTKSGSTSLAFALETMGAVTSHHRGITRRLISTIVFSAFRDLNSLRRAAEFPILQQMLGPQWCKPSPYFKKLAPSRVLGWPRTHFGRMVNLAQTPRAPSVSNQRRSWFVLRFKLPDQLRRAWVSEQFRARTEAGQDQGTIDTAPTEVSSPGSSRLSGYCLLWRGKALWYGGWPVFIIDRQTGEASADFRLPA